MAMNSSVSVREARIEDVPAILGLIRELAAFENLSHAVQADEATLRAHGFGPEPRFHVLIAEAGGEVVGFLSYMIRYSIWGGGDFINLDDLFVSERARGGGVGRLLMRRMAEIAVARDMAVRWELLPDNARAKAFYEALGATVSDKLIARWTIQAARKVSATA